MCSLLSRQPRIKNVVVAYTSQRKLFLLSFSFWVFELSINKETFLRYRRLDTIETPLLSLRKNTSIMGSSDNNESTMKATKEEMKKAGIDLAYRDFCAHLLIPLNECRRKSFFPPVEVQRRTTRVREVSVRRVRYSRCCHRCSLYDRSSFVNSHQSLSL